MKNHSAIAWLLLPAACCLQLACSSGTDSGDSGEITHADSIDLPGDTETCPIKAGHADPLSLTSEEVAALIARFKERYPDEPLYGGAVSRTAFDRMLCETDANAVFYYLAKGDAGDGGEGPLFVVLAGAKIEGSGDDTRVTIVSEFYQPNNWCPPHCPPVPSDSTELTHTAHGTP
jgi:hypothetical protein